MTTWTPMGYPSLTPTCRPRTCTTQVRCPERGAAAFEDGTAEHAPDQTCRPGVDGLRRKVLVPLSNNRFGYWYLTRVAPRIDATLTPATKAWLSSVPGTPLLLITTIGAKSGKARTNPLIYWSRGDDVILMASNYGRDSHPAWLFNVKAHPEVTLLFRGKRATTGRGSPRAPNATSSGRRPKALSRTTAAMSTGAGKRNIQVVVCSPVAQNRL